jgi:hypothetical protein
MPSEHPAAPLPPAPRPTRARAQRYVDEIVAAAQALRDDDLSSGDLKILRATVQEMRGAFKAFAPYQHLRKVSTFGSARTEPGDPTFRLAERFARHIADAGFMVITGAGSGIMEACQRGAGRARSFGVNIELPFEQVPNPIIQGDPKFMTFRYFFVRKLFFLKEAHAVVLFPGGFGTHDEAFETLTLVQTGKSKPLPIIFLDTPRGTYWKTWQRYVEDHLLRRRMITAEDLALYKVTDRVDVAVREITDFYRVFHSSRYVRDLIVLRLSRRLPEAFVDQLTDEFPDLVSRGGFVQRGPFREERDEPELAHLPRLAFAFNRIKLGRLRSLIDRINRAPAGG